MLAGFSVNFHFCINQKMLAAIVTIVWNIKHIFARDSNRRFHKNDYVLFDNMLKKQD
jgi:hypothetical protein